jgi:hypothetical protein
MEISSHYYALLALCRACGINKYTSYEIAYASQFVDDAKINCLIGDKESLYNIATCHSYFKPNTYNLNAMIYNTSLFHFIPSCSGKEFTQKLVCKEDSRVINEILNNNLTSSPQKFGMLLHIYADTFSHQGFSGILSKNNSITELKEENGTFKVKFEVIKKRWMKNIIHLLTRKLDFENLLPSYGHGQAFHYPDIPYLEWSYKYDEEENETSTIKINNRDRFKRAFVEIKNYLQIYIKENNIQANPASKEVFDEFFEILATKSNDDEKIELWQKFILQNGFYDASDQAIEYDENAWLSECFEEFDEDTFHARVLKDVKFATCYKSSSWYQFIIGLKEYKDEIGQILKNCGLELPK